MTRIELTELVSLAQNGNKSALKQIYLITRNAVIKKAYSATNNLDDAEDILQSCYLTVIEKLKHLKDPKSFEKWFNVIVTNKIKDFKKKKAPVLLNESDYNSLSNKAETNSDYIPHENLERKDNCETVRAFVNELDSKKHQSIKMFYFEEKSISEIADELNIPENTVKSRLNHGRKEIERKSKISAKKILLTVLIIALLFALSLLCVTSSEKYKFSMDLIHTDKGWADLNFVNRSNDKSYEEIIHNPYEPTYIPEGYEQINFDTSPSWMHYKYQNKNGNYLTINQYLTSDNMAINNTDTTFERKRVNGDNIIFSRHNDQVSYYWTNDSYTFAIHTKTALSEEEAENVIKGLKPMF